MKYTIIFILFINFIVQGQITDETTLLINNYFQITNENIVSNNNVISNSESKSYVNLLQTGNNNRTYINSLQSDDNQIVSQKGNQNSYEYYNYYSRENSNIIINQEGNQNSIQMFGENSLMKNATINQKSNLKSIVIKNYIN